MFRSVRYIPLKFKSGRFNSTVENGNVKSTRMNRKLNNVESNETKKTTQIITSVGAISLASIVLLSYAIYDVNQNDNGYFNQLYRGSSFEKVIDNIYENTIGTLWVDVAAPSNDKLLPDFGDPEIYGQIPPGTPAPPILVLDVEKTIIGSVYDASLGWRHARRPGLEKFLKQLSGYYEIVIMNENDGIIGPDVHQAVDPENRCHHLTSTAGELRDGRIIKRLDLMNRKINKIILIDDSEYSSQLFPRNTLLVKPFDANDTSDTVLLDLIPLLQALVHENSDDFRDTIDSLGTHQAEEAVIEYQMRVSKKKAQENQRRNKGLGGILRGNTSRTNELSDNLEATKSSIMSLSQIVGEVPAGMLHETGQHQSDKNPNIPKVGFQPVDQTNVVKKKGRMFEMMDQHEKEKEEKMKLMQEIAMKREMDKQRQESNKTQERI